MMKKKKNEGEAFTCKYQLYRRQSHYHDSLQSSAPQVPVAVLKVFLTQKSHHIYSVCLHSVWAFFGKCKLTTFGLLFKWSFIHLSLHLCVALSARKFEQKRTARSKWKWKVGLRLTSNYHECSEWEASVASADKHKECSRMMIKRDDAKSVAPKSVAGQR